MAEKLISTSEFAQRIRVKNETIRRGYCVKGHYLRVRPIKLENGRLLWPEQEVEKAIHREAA